MTISEQIKVLCVRSDISVAELARRIGTSPQNLSGKMKRENEIAFFISLLRICNPQVLSSQLQSNKHLKYSLQIGFYLIGFKILILITNPA